MQVGLSIKPAKPVSGENQFQISLKNEKGPIDGAKVTVDYFMPAMGTMPEMQGSSAAEPSGKGIYVATMTLPMEGNWTITVRAMPPSGEPLLARFGIRTGAEAITSQE